MKDYGKKTLKVIELFGARWGRHTQTSFVCHAPTTDEINSILERIYHPDAISHRKSVVEVAVTAFAAHVEMDSYSDYKPGYRSNIFLRDVYAVLNTETGEVFVEKIAAVTTGKPKSKAMSLGNRLAVKGQSRSHAFKKAWAIVKQGGLELAVKGVSFGNRQEALRRLAGYAPGLIKTVFTPEPENTFDPNAVAVKVGVQNGKGLFKLGYLPRELTGVVRAMKTGSAQLKVVSGNTMGRTIYGARLRVAV